LAVEERIAVAYITRTKGVRGEVKAEVLTHCLSRFDELSQIVLQKEGQADRSLVLERWRPEGPGVLLKFAGIDTLEEAREVLVRGYVTITPEEVASLPEDAFYVYELVGCTVEDESGRRLGEIADVLSMPSTDVFQVRGEDGELLIPAVENFVVEISIPERRVVVKGVEELLELR